jgi:hypothetical protein
MTFDYVAMQAVSTSLLTQAGQSVTRTVVTVGAYNPATGEATTTTSTSTRKGALLNYGEAGRVSERNVRGNLVEIGDRKLLLDATGAVALTDIYTIQGEQFTVVSIKPTNPAGTDVLFELHVRLS